VPRRGPDTQTRLHRGLSACRPARAPCPPASSCGPARTSHASDSCSPARTDPLPDERKGRRPTFPAALGQGRVVASGSSGWRPTRTRPVRARRPAPTGRTATPSAPCLGRPARRPLRRPARPRRPAAGATTPRHSPPGTGRAAAPPTAGASRATRGADLAVLRAIPSWRRAPHAQPACHPAREGSQQGIPESDGGARPGPDWGRPASRARADDERGPELVAPGRREGPAVGYAAGTPTRRWERAARAWSTGRTGSCARAGRPASRSPGRPSPWHGLVARAGRDRGRAVVTVESGSTPAWPSIPASVLTSAPRLPLEPPPPTGVPRSC
jgi:hypothetical protein